MSTREEKEGTIPAQDSRIAVFIDFDNLAIGAAELNGARFDVELVLQRLRMKGRTVYRRAYCDWSRHADAAADLHRAGVGLVDMPMRHSGKNSADIQMVVDAMELCAMRPHIDFFALLSGDSDFSPLVAKLREHDKWVFGCGVRSSTSSLLVSGCDEFVYYDDLIEKTESVDEKAVRAAMDDIAEAVEGLRRDYDPVWGSMLKPALRRLDPSFDEGALGYGSFSDLLEDAHDRGIIDVHYRKDRRNYEVSLPRRN